MGATLQTEADIVALVSAVRTARAARDRATAKTLAGTLARRHRVYALPHCLSADDDRYGPVPPHLTVFGPRGYPAGCPPDTFHFKLNLCADACHEWDEVISCCGATAVFNRRVASLPRFRRRVCGSTYPAFGKRSIIGLGKMTNHQRQTAVMLYVYGFGSRCMVLTAPFRCPMLRAITLVQVLLLGMGNLRPLTEQEAYQTFTVVGREVYKALSALRALVVRYKRRRAEPDWRAYPDHVQSPDPDESTDTADTLPHEANPPVDNAKALHVVHHCSMQCSLSPRHTFMHAGPSAVPTFGEDSTGGLR